MAFFTVPEGEVEFPDIFEIGEVIYKQQDLNFFPLPQGQGALRLILAGRRMTLSGFPNRS